MCQKDTLALIFPAAHMLFLVNGCYALSGDNSAAFLKSGLASKALLLGTS